MGKDGNSCESRVDMGGGVGCNYELECYAQFMIEKSLLRVNSSCLFSS
jgi:hypothetical protein